MPGTATKPKSTGVAVIFKFDQGKTCANSKRGESLYSRDARGSLFLLRGGAVQGAGLYSLDFEGLAIYIK